MITQMKALHAWANSGWATIWLQSVAGLLFVFGLICLLDVESDALGIGAFFAFAQHLIPDGYLSAFGASSVIAACAIGIATIPAQRRRFARFKQEQTMLQRKDWRR